MFKRIILAGLILKNLIVMVNSAYSCNRERYRERYYDSKTTMEYTNLICNSINNSTDLTNYYCGDVILQNGLDIPNEDGCYTSTINNKIRELRINLEFLNEIICQEIRIKNLTTNTLNIPDLYCIPPGSLTNSFISNYKLSFGFGFIFGYVYYFLM